MSTSIHRIMLTVLVLGVDDSSTPTLRSWRIGTSKILITGYLYTLLPNESRVEQVPISSIFNRTLVERTRWSLRRGPCVSTRLLLCQGTLDSLKLHFRPEKDVDLPVTRRGFLRSVIKKHRDPVNQEYRCLPTFDFKLSCYGTLRVLFGLGRVLLVSTHESTSSIGSIGMSFRRWVTVFLLLLQTVFVQPITWRSVVWLHVRPFFVLLDLIPL